MVLTPWWILVLAASAPTQQQQPPERLWVARGLQAGEWLQTYDKAGMPRADVRQMVLEFSYAMHVTASSTTAKKMPNGTAFHMVFKADKNEFADLVFISSADPAIDGTARLDKLPPGWQLQVMKDGLLVLTDGRCAYMFDPKTPLDAQAIALK
jgi:hypothetical protein